MTTVQATTSPALLLLAALATEAASLDRACRRQRPADSVRVLQCGIGCRAVLAASRPHVAGASLVGSIGVSGALAPQLETGTVILAEAICNRAPGLEPAYACSQDLVHLLEQAMEQAAIPCRRGTLLCTDAPLLTPADKLAAHRQTGALAVDMESAAAAHAARAAGRPFFCLRVICDPAERLLAPELLCGVDRQGNSRPLRVLAALARRPRLLAPLLAMARDFARARRQMEQAWQAACTPLVRGSLSGPGHAGPPGGR